MVNQLMKIFPNFAEFEIPSPWSIKSAIGLRPESLESSHNRIHEDLF
jgi:hypothetical protein